MASQFKYLKYDLYRYFYMEEGVEPSLYEKIRTIVISQGIWAIITYRFSRWVKFECSNKWIRSLLKPIVFFGNLWIQISTGIQIWLEADIGPGLYIGHFGNILIGPTQIGKFCNLSQGNTIGFTGRGRNKQIPVVGDYVYMGDGAKIIGGVRVGNNVAIGANAVVTKDLPDNAVAVGVPAKIVSYKSSKGYINFDVSKFKDIL